MKYFSEVTNKTYDTVEALKYVIQWIESKEHLLKGFKVDDENEE